MFFSENNHFLGSFLEFRRSGITFPDDRRLHGPHQSCPQEDHDLCPSPRGDHDDDHGAALRPSHRGDHDDDHGAALRPSHRGDHDDGHGAALCPSHSGDHVDGHGAALHPHPHGDHDDDHGDARHPHDYVHDHACAPCFWPLRQR